MLPYKILSLLAVLCLLLCPAQSFRVPDPLELEWRGLPEAWVVDDYETVSYPGAGVSTGIAHWSLTSTVPSTGRDYTIHVGSMSSGLPGNFSFQLPTGGCCHQAKSSDTAKLHQCTYATNAGFFNTKNGCCLGHLIINSTIQMFGSTNRSNFGLTQSSYMLGYMTNATIKNAKFLTMISGAGWLVRDGISYINISRSKEGLAEKFVTEKAPRTAVVVHKNGTLSLMQVDGVELITVKGLDLLEFSEILVQLGAWQAINIDGGGSSVSVYKDEVISKPTCHDIPQICERAVSSIACMKDG